jgi:hypothetical protein
MLLRGMENRPADNLRHRQLRIHPYEIERVGSI